MSQLYRLRASIIHGVHFIKLFRIFGIFKMDQILKTLRCGNEGIVGIVKCVRLRRKGDVLRSHPASPLRKQLEGNPGRYKLS